MKSDALPPAIPSPKTPEDGTYATDSRHPSSRHLTPSVLRGRITCHLWPLKRHVRSIARSMITSIVNPNMIGVYRELRPAEEAGDLEIRQAWDFPLSVAYWHLGELVAGGRVEECEHCRNLFVQTRRDQRFCPPPPFTSESSCASAARQRRKRKEG